MTYPQFINTIKHKNMFTSDDNTLPIAHDSDGKAIVSKHNYVSPEEKTLNEILHPDNSIKTSHWINDIIYIITQEHSGPYRIAKARITGVRLDINSTSKDTPNSYMESVCSNYFDKEHIGNKAKVLYNCITEDSYLKFDITENQIFKTREQAIESL